MKKQIYLLWLMLFLTFFLQIFSTQSIYAYDVEYNYLTDVMTDQKPFFMNSIGTVVFKQMDDNNIRQIYIFKNGETKQITNYKLSDAVVIQDAFSINDKDQIAWVQIESNGEGISNSFVMLYDPSPEKITKISKLIGEKNNVCAYLTINDNGEVAWMQRGQDYTISKLFVYKNGITSEIFSTTEDIYGPNINNNGYVVYSLSDYPGSNIFKVFLWDGKQHIRIDNSKEKESCMNPLIDNQNNIIYELRNEQGKRFFMFYSGKTGEITKIDVEIETGVSLTSFNDVVLENGSLLFIGKDGHIYFYKDEKVERLTSDKKNNSPAMKGEWLAWIFRDANDKGKIMMRAFGKEITLDSVDCYLGLHLSANGQFLFTRINPQNLSTLNLYYGKINFQANVDSDSNFENKIIIYPNPVDDYISIYFKTLHNISNSDVIIRDINGRIVNKSKIIAGAYNHLIDTRNLENGTYFVEYNNGIEVFIEKIIINR